MASSQKAMFSLGASSPSPFVVKRTFLEYDHRSDSSECQEMSTTHYGRVRSVSDSCMYECSNDYYAKTTDSLNSTHVDSEESNTSAFGEDTASESTEAAKEDSSEVDSDSLVSSSKAGQDDLAMENARLMEENEKLRQQCIEVSKAAAASQVQNYALPHNYPQASQQAIHQNARPELEQGLWNSEQGQCSMAVAHQAEYSQMALNQMQGMNPYASGGALYPTGLPMANVNGQNMFVFDMASGMQMQCVPMWQPMQTQNPCPQQDNFKKQPAAKNNQRKRREDVQQQKTQKRQPQQSHAPPGVFEARTAPAPPAPPSCSEDSRTTVMLRNLPNNYSRSMLLSLMDSEGFEKLYDFIYLPIDFKTKASLGYAFVNLTDNESANRFRLRFDGFAEWILPTRKVCGVSWSGPHQGLEAHIERYRNSPVMHEAVPDMYKPVLFKDGIVVAFPPPTKTLRAPRIRHFHGPGCVFSPMEAAGQEP